MSVHKPSSARIFFDIETIGDEAAPTHACKGCTWEGVPRVVIDVDGFLAPAACPECGLYGDDVKELTPPALHLTRCRVVSLCFAVNDGEVESWSAHKVWAAMDAAEFKPEDKWRDTEADMLAWLSGRLFANGIKTRTPGILVTFKGRAFDVPRMHLIALLHDHGLATWFPVPRPGQKPWDVADRHEDLADFVSCGPWFRGNHVRQRDLAERFGVASDLQPGMGDQVARWHASGESGKIVEHNRADVIELRELYRLLFGWRKTPPPETGSEP